MQEYWLLFDQRSLVWQFDLQMQQPMKAAYKTVLIETKRLWLDRPDPGRVGIQLE